MSLEIKIKNILNDFDSVSSDEFLTILHSNYVLKFKTNLTT